MKPREVFPIFPQWAFDAIFQAPAPEFFYRYVQKYRRPVSKQLTIPLLGESAASECDHGVACERFRQILEGNVFGLPEAGLTLLSKNLRDAFPLASLDSGVQVDEVPPQAAGEFGTYRTLS